MMKLDIGRKEGRKEGKTAPTEEETQRGLGNQGKGSARHDMQVLSERAKGNSR